MELKKLNKKIEASVAKKEKKNEKMKQKQNMDSRFQQNFISIALNFHEL